ncbi:MAG: hypothetical protein O3B75_02730 [Planctomycetota bacterium]|nr:hypothetical protein [Planctomycetota bacterium]
MTSINEDCFADESMANIDPILTIVARVRRRMLLGQFLSWMGRATFWAGIFLVVVSVLAKLVAVWWSPAGERGMWFVILCAVLLASLGGWAFLTRLRGEGDVAVASVIDVRLKLHDRLSTAVAVADRTDPFAQAAIEDGIKIASDKRLVESLGRAIPLETPRNWWAGPSFIVMACAVWWFVPGLSLGNAQPTESLSAAELQAARDAAKVQIETLQAKIETNSELSKALGEEAGKKNLAGELTDEKLQTPESVRRETTRQVNELSKKLDELLSGEKAQQLEAMKDALSRIEPSKSGPLKELGEALKRGDGAAAKSALDKLQDQVKEGKMDEKSREELAAKLSEMASQLKDAAKANETLKKALENSGLDGALAKNPQAAKAAIDAAKNLNDAQKKALKEALQSQSKAGEKLEKIAKACESMCSQCKNGSKSGSKSSDSSDGKSSKSGESSQESAESSAACSKDAGDVLSEMEMLSEMLKDAESARSQCQGGAQPSEKPGESRMNAGPGRGTGGERTKEKTETATRTRKEKVKSTGGDVIARQLVEAPPVVGESRATLQQLSGEIGRGYEEGTEEDPVPANLRDLHKHYFGDLKKKIDAKSGQVAPASTDAPNPSQEPVESASPAVPPAKK